jgi:hypothetical protein
MYKDKNALWDESNIRKKALRQQEENPQDVVVSSLLPESKSGSKVDGIKADSKMRKAWHRESAEGDWGGITAGMLR